jgi:hypothetical protein
MLPAFALQLTAVFAVFVTNAVKGTDPPDATVAAAGVTVITTAAETVIWKVCDPATLLESVTLTPKLKVPVVVGVPETLPLLVLSRRSAGSCPDEIAKLYGPVPPPTVSGTL